MAVAVAVVAMAMAVVRGVVAAVHEGAVRTVVTGRAVAERDGDGRRGRPGDGPCLP
jgi:hypothetical protein